VAFGSDWLVDVLFVMSALAEQIASQIARSRIYCSSGALIEHKGSAVTSPA
jgi:hypothetical protein